MSSQSSQLASNVIKLKEDDSKTIIHQEMSDFYGDVISGDKTLECSKTLDYVIDSLNKEKVKLQFLKLSKLWFKYQRMIDTIFKLIRADRIGLWDLDLEAIKE